MPLNHREITVYQTEFLIWKITESEEELREGLSLSPAALGRLSARRSSSHRKGYLAIRQLLKILDIPPAVHQYEAVGAPYLTDGRFISFSHSQELAAVALSTVSVGIDLEHYKEKIRRIAPRFLHPSENEIPKGAAGLIYLTQIWTAKEALYKAFKKKGLIFNTQLRIDPFEDKATNGKGWVIEDEQQTPYALQYRIFNNYCFTLAIPL